MGRPEPDDTGEPDTISTEGSALRREAREAVADPADLAEAKIVRQELDTISALLEDGQ